MAELPQGRIDDGQIGPDPGRAVEILMTAHGEAMPVPQPFGKLPRLEVAVRERREV